MGSKEIKDYLGKMVTYIVITAIIAGIIWGIVYANKQKQNGKLANNDDTKVEPTGVKEDPDQETRIIKYAEIFVDENKNGSKDENEVGCDVCIARALAYTTQTESLPLINDLKYTTIKSAGELDVNEIQTAKIVWGFFEDREIIIPNQPIKVDLEGNVFIPAWKTNVSVVGLNANIKEVLVQKKIKGQYALRYTFETLVPSLQAAAEENKSLWVYLTPDPNNLGLSYLVEAKIAQDKTGSIVGKSNGYYIDVVWKIDQNLPASLDPKNIAFVLL